MEAKILDLARTDLFVDAAPRHVALIMDGNGTWAAAQGLPRIEGHLRGLETLRRGVCAAIELGIPYHTVYFFSAENLSQSPEEAQRLRAPFHRFIRNDLLDRAMCGCASSANAPISRPISSICSTRRNG